MDDVYEELTVPEQVPERGFYYHYKHNSSGDITNYAYEVVGIGLHTEDDCRPEDQCMVVYRPLYSSAKVYELGKMFYLRPLSMFMEAVNKPEYQGPRFQKIEEMELTAKLKVIRDEMYPTE